MRQISLLLIALCALALVDGTSGQARAVDCPTGSCPLQPPSSPAEVAVDARPIARIENTTPAARAYGTGTLVDVDDDRGLVVTCAHLFREGVGTVRVSFPNRPAQTARVLKADHNADLAALAIPPLELRPVEVAQQFPQRGDMLVSCGYGGDGRLWSNRGQALGYVTTVGSYGRETLELSGSARLGDSGGPVLDGNGYLVAVLFGTDGRVVDATFCGRVRKFLAGLSPRFGQAPNSDASASNDEPREKLEDVPPRILRPQRSPREQNPADADPLAKAADAVTDAAAPWLTAKLTGLLVSLGVPGGIAGVAGGGLVWLVMRRGKKQLRAEIDRLKARAEQVPPNSPASDSTGVLASSTAGSVVERHHNRYVAYEAGSVDKAWAAAHARVGEKYPGAVPYLKIVEGVKDQLLSGIEEPLIS